jgi:dihydroorotate dehydrogenase electron transfer subunit
MKCGIGVCDACSLDGRLVCRDGPVFDGDFLLGSEDFGRFRLSPNGTRIPV